MYEKRVEFQSLIGRLRTKEPFTAEMFSVEFQSLIGRLRTW
ncbi:hypothetical protein CAAU_0838 [Caloramator australicus RC3]|uniref:Uncharacterized protein n=1 Tax=Caloramator australicus RC3 TaxID=857293 RepID=I7LIG1_9CLOT|nr:hypothetical protein CAAU_0838 [Caloramator australicus RC3]